MREGYWALRKYRSGRIGETVKYWVPGRKPTRSERRLKSDIKKAASNEQNVERAVARLIHANYRNCKDILLGLDYSTQGYEKMSRPAEAVEDPEEERDRVWWAARHQVELYLRRVRRACAAEGIPLRTMAFTSDMDGKTQEAVRVHHHIIVNVEALEICIKKWSLGGVHYDTLWDRDDQTDLAVYLVQQVRRIPDAAKYIPSRNLVRPKPRDRIAINGSELRIPKGARLLYRGPYREGQPQYIRYVLPESTEIPEYPIEGRQRE